MRYSVYDYRRGVFDYYDGVGESPASGRFRAPQGNAGIPESIAARLPPGAVPAGSGREPQGVIATTSAALGALEMEGVPKFPWVPLVAGVAVAWWWFGRDA